MTTPEGTDFIRFNINIPWVTGTVYLDNVQLIEVSDNLFKNGGFEKLDEMLEQALEMELDENNYVNLCTELEQGGKLLYLTDNAGEIGFDRVFAQLLPQDKLEKLKEIGINLFPIYERLNKTVG